MAGAACANPGGACTAGPGPVSSGAPAPAPAPAPAGAAAAGGSRACCPSATILLAQRQGLRRLGGALRWHGAPCCRGRRRRDALGAQRSCPCCESSIAGAIAAAAGPAERAARQDCKVTHTAGCGSSIGVTDNLDTHTPSFWEGLVDLQAQQAQQDLGRGSARRRLQEWPEVFFSSPPTLFQSGTHTLHTRPPCCSPSRPGHLEFKLGAPARPLP